MLRMITSEEAQAGGREDVLETIYGGKVHKTSTWVETDALLITEVTGEPFHRYFMIVITNDVTEDDVLELNRLAAELGKNLPDCVVERERYEMPHRFFPGSKHFDLVTVYGG
jgi:hypothetical protein